jgi:hypothetical protein
MKKGTRKNVLIWMAITRHIRIWQENTLGQGIMDGKSMLGRVGHSEQSFIQWDILTFLERSSANPPAGKLVRQSDQS